ncbi:MAG: HlyD family efflux transporter periplasmic adaptor subunit [Desulforhabdus sp.]|nr:HlyD family efflux transporter periplasmic adaptor subunit [Desulforhabdus sp.]
MRTKGRVGLVLILVVLASAGAGYWWWRSGQQSESVDRLVLYGNVDIRQVELAFNGSERIVGMLVEEGDVVRAGQLLAEIDRARLEQAVARAAAQVLAQEEVVARLEAGSRRQEIRRARAEAEAAEAEAGNALRMYERRRPLVRKDALSKEQTDNAKTTAEAAEARFRAARETLDLAVEGPRKEDIAAAKATLNANRAELALEQRKLADAFLYAPSDGVIQDRILQPGDMASPQRAVYTLALTDPVWVRVYVSESDLGRLWPGMSATVTTDSYPAKHYEAWVGFISPTAEFTPKTVETTELRTRLVYQVRVFACNPQNELRLGMPATVTILLDQPRMEDGAESYRCNNR